jgi:hypothetical protein
MSRLDRRICKLARRYPQPRAERFPDALLAQVDFNLAPIAKNRIEAARESDRQPFVPVWIVARHAAVASIAGAGGNVLDNLILIFEHA